MRIKLVASAEPSLLEKVKEVTRPRSFSLYKELLLFHPKGAYGLPELVGIRYPPEREEKAYAVHYGHDIRSQEEKVIEYGEKDRLVYKYLQLGFQRLGEFTVEDYRFAWREFNGKFICIGELGLCFLILEREFPGEDTDVFEEKQRRAWRFFSSLGFNEKSLIPVDYWGFVVMGVLQGGNNEGSISP